MILLSLVFFICSVLSQKFKGTKLEILAETFKTLSLKPPKSFNLLDSDNIPFSLSSQLTFRCVQLRFSHITSTLEQKYDTGRDACGVVLTELRGTCKSDKLHNIQILTNNIIFPEKNKVSPTILNMNNDKVIKIDVNTYIKRISLIWRYNSSGRFLTAIKVKSGNNKEQSISCSDTYQSIESMTFTKLERINGFYVSFNSQQISDIDFFFHRLVSDVSKENLLESRNSVRENHRVRHTVRASDEDYSLIITSNYLYSNEVEDTFEIRGPFGEKMGKKFSDSFIYGHWTIDSISAYTNSTHILGVGLTMKNLFINQSVKMPVYGVSKGTLQTLKVPPGKSVVLIETFITPDFRPCALRFGLNTGGTLGVLGDSSCIANAKSNNVLIGDRENLFGLTGYEDDNKIRSIGFIIILKNGDDIMSL